MLVRNNVIMCPMRTLRLTVETTEGENDRKRIVHGRRRSARSLQWNRSWHCVNVQERRSSVVEWPLERLGTQERAPLELS